MFCNLTVNTVQGAHLNLPITADLNHDNKNLERGKSAAKSRRGIQVIVGLISGGKQVLIAAKNLCIMGRLPLKYMKELKRKIAGYV